MKRNEVLNALPVPRYNPEWHHEQMDQAKLTGEQRLQHLVDGLLRVGVFYPHGDEDRPVPLGSHYSKQEPGYKVPFITVIHAGDDKRPSPFTVDRRASSYHVLVLDNEGEVGPRSLTLAMSYGFASVDSGWTRGGESIDTTHQDLPYGHGPKTHLDMIAVDTDGNRILFTDSPRPIHEIILFAGFVAPVEHSDGVHHVGGVVVLE